MVKGKSLEVVDVAVGRVRRRKWKGVVIEGHPTTAETAGRNKKGRTKGRRGDGLRQGEHEAKGTRRRYVTLRLRQSERSERSETSTKDKISGPTAELPLQLYLKSCNNRITTLRSALVESVVSKI
jgi:hypothetical protein